MSTPQKVRLAFIGLKGINDWHFLPGLKNVPEAELVAGVDPSPEARASFAQKSQVPTYGSLSELLAQHTIDAVFIGTPNQFHLPNIREAVEHGLHVAVTKPLANNVSESREAVEICARGGRLLQVNHEYRYRPAIAAGIALARQGDIGEITLVEAHMGSNGGIATGNAGTWRANPANAPGGCVNLIGIHMLDCANSVLGTPIAITARLKCVKSTFGMIDTAGILIDYQEGGLGSVTVSYASSHRDSIVFHGTEGNLVMTDRTLHRMVKRELTPLEIPPSVSSAEILIRQFCRAILEGAPLEFPGEAGLLLVAMNDASVISSDEGRTVKIIELLPEAQS